MVECVVYRIYLLGMAIHEGYVGVSKHFDLRMQQHARAAFVNNSIYTVHEMMREHKDFLIMEIIFRGTVQECYEYEYELRPSWRMGWNMAMGGGYAGSGWKVSEKWMTRELYHREHGTEYLSADNTILDVATKYTKNPASSSGNFTRVLYGNIPHAYGWEIADQQLQMKVLERYNRDWESGYMRRTDDNSVVVYIEKSGKKAISESVFKTDMRTNYKGIFNGTQEKSGKWEIATEQEWLETAERLEFK